MCRHLYRPLRVVKCNFDDDDDESYWLFKNANIFLTQDTLRKLYTGTVEPHFRYCCSVWVKNAAREKETTCNKYKNRAVRILANISYNADARPLPNDLGLKKFSI